MTSFLLEYSSSQIGQRSHSFAKPSFFHASGLRRYIRDILMTFTVIHHQVSSISPHFIQRIFNILAHMITEEFSRIFECIQTFSSTGALQARVELTALQMSLDNYMTDESRFDKFRVAQGIIPSSPKIKRFI